MKELAQLEQEIFNCNKCERLRSVSPTPWPHVYYGKPENLTLMIVMRNPGLENDPNKIGLQEFKDNYKDLWLRCRVGKYLLENLGKDVVMNKMFFCNICKCSSPSNSSLAFSEVAHCSKYLMKQIGIIKPKLIMSFGSEANNVVKSLSINAERETFYHPSYLGRVSQQISKQQNNKINIILKKHEI